MATRSSKTIPSSLMEPNVDTKYDVDQYPSLDSKCRAQSYLFDSESQKFEGLSNYCDEDIELNKNSVSQQQSNECGNKVSSEQISGEVEQKVGMKKQFKQYLIFSILSMVMFYSCIIMAFFYDPLCIVGTTIIFFYLFWSYFFETTTNYIYNIKDVDTIFQCLIESRNCRPNIQLVSSTFFNEQLGQGGKHRTYKKVCTHQTSDIIKYSKWDDSSQNLVELRTQIFNNQISMLKVTKNMTYSKVIIDKIEEQKQKLLMNSNKNKDEYVEVELRENVEEFIPYSIVFNPKAQGNINNKPWYINKKYLNVLDTFLLGWVQRLVLYSSTKQFEYSIRKNIQQ